MCIRDSEIINPMHKAMRAAGFADTRSLFFPQPCYPSGWWTATMATRSELDGSFREQDVQDGGIDTQYYNADIHRAALAAPAFFAGALE